MEGDAARHEALTFSFKFKDMPDKEILCEPHMKIVESAKAGDGKFYFNRIYFTPAKDAPEGVSVFVGHVGKHL
jgi:hypothetical protein